jgi:hypothetical protein
MKELTHLGSYMRVNEIKSDKWMNVKKTINEAKKTIRTTLNK